MTILYYDLDLILIIIFLMFTLLSNIYLNYSKKNINTNSNNTSDKKIKFIFHMIATIIGGGTIFGLTNKIINGQIEYTYALIISMIVQYFILITISKKLTNYTNYTEILYKHYGRLGSIVLMFFGVMNMMFTMAIQIHVGKNILSYFFHLSDITSIMLSYGIIILFLQGNKIRSLINTNFIQFIAIIVTTIVLNIILCNKVGYHTIDLLSHISHKNILYNTASLTFTFILTSIQPAMINNIILIKNSEQIHYRLKVMTIIYICIIIMISINAILMSSLQPIDVHHFQLSILSSILPTGIKAIVIYGFLSAVISTSSTDIYFSSFSIKQILKQFNYSSISTNNLSILIGISTLFIANIFDNSIDIAVFATLFWAPVTFVPMIFSLYNIYIPKKYFFIGVIIFAIIPINLYYFFPNIPNGNIIGILLHLVYFFIIYKIFDRKIYD